MLKPTNDSGWLYRQGHAEHEHVELPDGGGTSGGRGYPFRRMEVGDRFVMVLPMQRLAANDTKKRVAVACWGAQKETGAQFARVREGAVLTYTRVG